MPTILVSIKSQGGEAHKSTKITEDKLEEYLQGDVGAFVGSVVDPLAVEAFQELQSAQDTREREQRANVVTIR